MLLSYDSDFPIFYPFPLIYNKEIFYSSNGVYIQLSVYHYYINETILYWIPVAFVPLMHYIIIIYVN
jgi:hypothetical protein